MAPARTRRHEAVFVYVQARYWPQICAAVGFVGIVTGIVLLLRRRGYRSSRSRLDFEKTR